MADFGSVFLLYLRSPPFLPLLRRPPRFPLGWPYVMESLISAGRSNAKGRFGGREPLAPARTFLHSSALEPSKAAADIVVKESDFATGPSSVY